MFFSYKDFLSNFENIFNILWFLSKPVFFAKSLLVIPKYGYFIIYFFQQFKKIEGPDDL